MPGVRVANGRRRVTYVHLMFEAHQIIFAEDIPSESFYPGPMSMRALDKEAAAEFATLFPALYGKDLDRAQTVTHYGGTVRDVVKKRAVPELMIDAGVC